jgi:hypothetical protein
VNHEREKRMEVLGVIKKVDTFALSNLKKVHESVSLVTADSQS